MVEIGFSSFALFRTFSIESLLARFFKMCRSFGDFFLHIEFI
ncbi:hypothetical protein NECAME_08730, partial [Necator americanus]